MLLCLYYYLNVLTHLFCLKTWCIFHLIHSIGWIFYWKVLMNFHFKNLNLIIFQYFCLLDLSSIYYIVFISFTWLFSFFFNYSGVCILFYFVEHFYSHSFKLFRFSYLVLGELISMHLVILGQVIMFDVHFFQLEYGISFVYGIISPLVFLKQCYPYPLSWSICYVQVWLGYRSIEKVYTHWTGGVTH